MGSGAGDVVVATPVKALGPAAVVSATPPASQQQWAHGEALPAR
jgi:hypothetical protein